MPENKDDKTTSFIEDLKTWDPTQTVKDLTDPSVGLLTDSILKNKNFQQLTKLNTIAKKYHLPFAVTNIDLTSMASVGRDSILQNLLGQSNVEISTIDKLEMKKNVESQPKSDDRPDISKKLSGHTTVPVQLSMYALPFPNKIKVDSNFIWDTEALGIMGDSLLSAIDAGGIGAGVSKFMQGLAGSMMVKAGQGASEMLTGNTAAFTQVLQNKLGGAINSNDVIMFKGVTYRDFDFEYEFHPKSEQEAINIMALIYELHLHATPAAESKNASFNIAGMVNSGVKYINDKATNGDERLPKIPTMSNETGTFTLASIKTWSIPKSYHVKIVDNSTQIPNTILDYGECRITHISCDYTPDGIWATYKKGIPVHISLNIGFKQTQLPDSASVEKMFNLGKNFK